CVRESPRWRLLRDFEFNRLEIW
nr:immunoglobulin heavy chain junction region [Macaca mulatta]MOV49854.1 immunoglobulin heavy chain junction region [Macaca mulatta]MOV49935.1 immunoglobulin heavy chain junction region [Macaca mulatta]MOV49945.1 immunoglobulin heavy chain junction region [Macaca mulatta]MOV50206.1 immunoglobulin heavy chain junction region [Macaca mulatta]